MKRLLFSLYGFAFFNKFLLLTPVYAIFMQENGLKRADLAKKLGVSPQYVSRLLSGTENLSFKSIANIEEKLGVNCLDAALS